MTHKKIEYLIKEFKKEGMPTVYTKIVTYSSFSGKFETECSFERYLKSETTEDKLTAKSDEEMIKAVTKKLAELRLLKMEKTTLLLN